MRLNSIIMKSCRATTVSQPTNLVLQMWENMFVWYRPAQMSYHPDLNCFFFNCDAEQQQCVDLLFFTTEK